MPGHRKKYILMNGDSKTIFLRRLEAMATTMLFSPACRPSPEEMKAIGEGKCVKLRRRDDPLFTWDRPAEVPKVDDPTIPTVCQAVYDSGSPEVKVVIQNNADWHKPLCQLFDVIFDVPLTVSISRTSPGRRSSFATSKSRRETFSRTFPKQLCSQT